MGKCVIGNDVPSLARRHPWKCSDTVPLTRATISIASSNDKVDESPPIRRLNAGTYKAAESNEQQIVYLGLDLAQELLHSSDAFLHKCQRYIQPFNQRKVNAARAACFEGKSELQVRPLTPAQTVLRSHNDLMTHSIGTS